MFIQGSRYNVHCACVCMCVCGPQTFLKGPGSRPEGSESGHVCLFKAVGTMCGSSLIPRPFWSVEGGSGDETMVMSSVPLVQP